MTVLAAHRWPTNGHLVAEVAGLYLADVETVLDPTWGRGRWWTVWQPPTLIRHDLHTLDGVDFRQLPEADHTVDVAAYDPPYVCVGGRQTTGLADMHDRYGLTSAPATPAGLQEMIDAGLDELHRVVRLGGIVLVKCQDYISSGRLWPGTHHTLSHALGLGWELVDWLEHIGSPRPQPGGRRQVHARRNLSTLLVLRTPRRAS